MSEKPKAVSNVKRSEKPVLENKKPITKLLGIGTGLVLSVSTAFNQPSFAQPKAEGPKQAVLNKQEVKPSTAKQLVSKIIELYKQKADIGERIAKIEAQYKNSNAELPVEYTVLVNESFNKSDEAKITLEQLGKFPGKIVKFHDSISNGSDIPPSAELIQKRRTVLTEAIKTFKDKDYTVVILDYNSSPVYLLPKSELLKMLKSDKGIQRLSNVKIIPMS